MQRMNNKWWKWLLLTLIASLIIVGCGKDDGEGETDDDATEIGQPLDTTSDKVIATYEGVTDGEVTEGEFNLMLNVLSAINPQIAFFIDQPEMKDELLKQHIAQKSIASNVETTKEVEQEADEFIKAFEEQVLAQAEDDKQTLETFAKDRGFTEADLRQFLIDINKVNHYFAQQVSDQDIEAGYEDWKKEKDLRLYKAEIRHILVQVNEERDEEKAKKRAEEVKEKLDNGEDFAKLAEKYSDDPGSKDNGGSLGDEMILLADPISPLEQTFAETARDLPLNEPSDPVQTPFGFHIIEVKQREQLSFEDVKELVKNELSQKEYERYVNEELIIDKKA